ncbi:DUF4167 domain-containing protein [Litoreibacter albidus]|uniref:DUF4167 domain-containing protein n=1 Tax=Litoreibacter albidus TaxID=670155 RepID=A0A1H2XNT4_9RHOB|nr:DUF4167 domain-containing protein [Litoreibacter albidus]SDW94298.1 protein of unknown function [Litoreibacter albidus]
MRSTKSRSRGKNRNNNNNRSGVNVVNRVFDSSGPEGKVRGTPQQIIEKYQQLHRDAQLSNDRVAAENFSQHAEHYARMLGEAMKEQEAKRLAHEAQQQAQREQQQKRDQNRDQNQNRDQGQNQNRDQNNEQPRARNEDAKPEAAADTMSPAALAAAAEAREGEGAQPDVIDLSENGDTADSGLVETVEAAPKPARKPRTRKPKAKPTEEAAASKDETPAAE